MFPEPDDTTGRHHSILHNSHSGGFYQISGVREMTEIPGTTLLGSHLYKAAAISGFLGIFVVYIAKR